MDFCDRSVRGGILDAKGRVSIDQQGYLMQTDKFRKSLFYKELKMGWLRGLEPPTSGTTIQCSSSKQLKNATFDPCFEKM